MNETGQLAIFAGLAAGAFYLATRREKVPAGDNEDVASGPAYCAQVSKLDPQYGAACALGVPILTSVIDKIRGPISKCEDKYRGYYTPESGFTGKCSRFVKPGLLGQYKRFFGQWVVPGFSPDVRPNLEGTFVCCPPGSAEPKCKRNRSVRLPDFCGVGGIVTDHRTGTGTAGVP